MLARCSASCTLTLICLILGATTQGARGRETKDEAVQPGDGGSLAKILSDKSLWGSDFPKALSSLPTWEAAGENTVEVFPNQIVSRPPAEGESPAAHASRIMAALRRQPPRPKPAYAEFLRAAGPEGVSSLKVERVESFKDDQKPRVVMSAPSALFLAPGLDLATVEARLGPVKPVLRTIPTDGDRRPIVLTEYAYANGAVVFATSDITPEPQGNPKKKPIDRAILNVPSVSTEVFERRPR